MRALRFLVISLLFLGLPATLFADVASLPSNAQWYFHADFDKMRSTEAGQHIYGWLEDEVFSDIREEVGVDLDKEADTLTAYAVSEDRIVVVIDGRISQETEDKILAMGAASGSLDKLGSGSRTYYHIKENRGTEDDTESAEPGEEDDGSNVNIEVDGFEDGAYLSFAVKDKLMVASNREDIETLIANDGRIDAGSSPRGALFILSAERSLMQAGVQAGELGEEIGWDSNILRNTEQAALLIADEGGKLSIEAQLVATEKEMADSLASIVRGLISLQIFNEELDPELTEFLQNTSVSVDGTTLLVKVLLDPKTVVEAL
jgi:hypothetical protein